MSLWTNGNGAKRVVKINTVNSFTAPADGTDPTANPVYGGGQQVVYNGSDNTIPTVSGLTAGTTYWFKVFEYNGSAREHFIALRQELTILKVRLLLPVL